MKKVLCLIALVCFVFLNVDAQNDTVRVRKPFGGSTGDGISIITKNGMYKGKVAIDTSDHGLFAKVDSGVQLTIPNALIGGAVNISSYRNYKEGKPHNDTVKCIMMFSDTSFSKFVTWEYGYMVYYVEYNVWESDYQWPERRTLLNYLDADKVLLKSKIIWIAKTIN